MLRSLIKSRPQRQNYPPSHSMLGLGLEWGRRHAIPPDTGAVSRCACLVLAETWRATTRRDYG
jgi:hypothetical protein